MVLVVAVVVVVEPCLCTSTAVPQPRQSPVRDYSYFCFKSQVFKSGVVLSLLSSVVLLVALNGQFTMVYVYILGDCYYVRTGRNPFPTL